MPVFQPGEEVVAAIKAELDACEAQRRSSHAMLRLLTPVALIPAACVAAYGVWTLFSGATLPFWADDSVQFAFRAFLLVAMLASGGLWLAHWPSKGLQQSLRDRLLPRLFGFVGDVEYSHGTTPFTFEYLPKAALPSHMTVKFGDVLRGRHDFMRFELFEMKLRDNGRRSNKRVFDGIALAFDLPVDFRGLLLATPRMGAFSTFMRDTFSAPLSTLESGDGLLDAAFEFRTDDPGVMRQLIAGPLAGAFQSVRDGWRDGPPRLAFAGQVGFLLMPSSKDFFELPPVGTPVVYERDIQPMLGDLGRLLDTAALVRRSATGNDRPQAERGLLD